MSLLPNEDDLEIIHTRQYEIRVYQKSDDELIARGVVSDVKPPGLYVPDDPEPLEMHQMQLELRVSVSDLTIRDAKVIFETHPHSTCPLIARDYEALIGLSISRGFNRATRDLFGGERGCTHTNALLQALAPALVQAKWSIVIRASREKGEGTWLADGPAREERIRSNVNTCHVWAENGTHIEQLRRGEMASPLIPIRERLERLGRDPES